MAFPRPDLRRYSVEWTAGKTDSVSFGDSHPNLLGWELSYVGQHAAAGSLIVGIVEGRDAFYKSALMEYGDQDVAPMWGAGGRVYIPWPSITLEFFCMNGTAAGVEVIGRPVLCADNPTAHTYLLGSIDTTVAAAATTDIAIPSNACEYFCTLGTEDGPLNVLVQGGAAFADAWGWYEISALATSAGSITEGPWRPTPAKDGGNFGQIQVTTNGAGAVQVRTWFKFDFSACK